MAYELKLYKLDYATRDGSERGTVDIFATNTYSALKMFKTFMESHHMKKEYSVSEGKRWELKQGVVQWIRNPSNGADKDISREVFFNGMFRCNISDEVPEDVDE